MTRGLLRERKTRCARGHTADPYECCGKKPESRYGRPKGKLCDDCAALIKEGKLSRASLKGTTLTPHRFWEVDYAYPYIHTQARDHGRSIATAMYRLASALTTPAPADTPSWKKAPDYAKRKSGDPWPSIVDAKKDDNDWSMIVMFDPALRTLVNDLDATIRVALKAEYEEGKDDGRSVIRQLATGDMSLNDFDEALLSPEQQAERRKARRGY